MIIASPPIPGATAILDERRGSKNTDGPTQGNTGWPTTARIVKVVRGKRVVVRAKPQPTKIGSAAAGLGPAGQAVPTFRLLSTGQIYRVDDYGWALSGRNTIDLYMATPAEMNAWGAREEPIQILKWGDREESLRFLTPHQGYKHIRRMVLELQGNEGAAAQLQ